MSGRFITFEGPEGSGKSTHIRELADFLRSFGIEVVLTREPGGTALGEKIRSLIQHSADGEVPSDRTELLLFLASRSQHVQELILPELGRGRWVLCDRFYDSTLAYQGYGRGLDLGQLRMLNDFAVCSLKPDFTLLIDVSPETSRARLANRHGDGSTVPDRIESEEDCFHVRLRNGFLALAEAEQERFAVVNAERDKHIVQEEIRLCVTQRFPAILKTPELTNHCNNAN